MGREEETSPSVPASEGNECLPGLLGGMMGRREKSLDVPSLPPLGLGDIYLHIKVLD